MTGNEPGSGVSRRLADLRERIFGPRGRAAFARAIGVSPSTYNYYEKGRRPPADLLTRAAEVTGADLTWLLTGRGTAFPAGAASDCDTLLSHHARGVLDRFSHDRPAGPQAAAAAAALRALLKQIDQSLPPSGEVWRPQAYAPSATSIPIVGRTAAGLIASWETCFTEQDDPQVLERLIRGLEARDARQRDGDLKAPDPQGESEQPRDTTALLTQLSSPTPDGIVEFLDLPGIGPVEPGLFALRVDGDSMAPRICDGDLVVSRRSATPEPGCTAIVRVRGSVGVTVKLWRPVADSLGEGETVHLIPIHEAYDPTVLRRDDILWACRVLWLVRL